MSHVLTLYLVYSRRRHSRMCAVVSRTHTCFEVRLAAVLVAVSCNSASTSAWVCHYSMVSVAPQLSSLDGSDTVVPFLFKPSVSSFFGSLFDFQIFLFWYCCAGSTQRGLFGPQSKYCPYWLSLCESFAAVRAFDACALYYFCVPQVHHVIRHCIIYQVALHDEHVTRCLKVQGLRRCLHKK